MLAEGFSLLETLAFIKLVYPQQLTVFSAMEAALANGQFFYTTLSLMKISPDVAFQIEIAEKHGDFANNLLKIAQYIGEKDRQRRQLIGILLYPFVLFSLLISLVFGIRLFLLPQLESLQGNMETGSAALVINFLRHFPQIVLLTLIIALLVFLAYSLWKRQANPLVKSRFYTRLPVIGKLFRLYYTYYFANEFSQLLQIGYSLQLITVTFRDQNRVAFLSALGHYLDQRMQTGESFADSIDQLGLFNREFAAIIRQGELLDLLAIKTRLYSQKALTSFYREISQLGKVLQNILFVWVALTVVMVYLILMLPMLTMMGGL